MAEPLTNPQALDADLAFDERDLAEARRINRLLAAVPRPRFASARELALLQGALRISQRFPQPRLRSNLVIEQRTIRALGREAAVRILRPAKGPCHGVYIDIHGGAWALGNAQMDDRLNAAIVEACGLAVVSVDYRLVPTNPLRACQDDCETAAAWVLSDGEAVFGSGTVFIGGESAGAHLAVSTALRLRHRPEFARVAGMVLFYGCYDLTGCASLRAAGQDTLILHGPTLSDALPRLTPDLCEADRRRPDVSPAYADLRGLPPALILVGEKDPLLDDSLTLAQRWSAANGPVELHRVPEAPHAFNRLPTRVAAKANAYVRAWLNRRLEAEPARLTA